MSKAHSHARRIMGRFVSLLSEFGTSNTDIEWGSFEYKDEFCTLKTLATLPAILGSLTNIQSFLTELLSWRLPA